MMFMSVAIDCRTRQNDANIVNDKNAIDDIVDVSNEDFATKRKTWNMSNMLSATTVRNVLPGLRRRITQKVWIAQLVRSA